MADGGTTTLRDLGVLSHVMEIRAIREESREVDFICSTEDIDSYGTVIRQDGWDLSRFNANPVVLFCHDGDDLPIGQSVKHSVTDGKLLASVRIATAEANPLAENVWQSIRQRTLRGISVGFVPLEYHFESAGKGLGDILVFDRCLLVELSVTPVPSNTKALAQLRQFVAEHTAAPDTAGARGPSASNTQRDLTMADHVQDHAALQTKVSELETKNRDLDFAVRESKKSAEDHEKRATELAEKVGTLEIQNKRLAEERDAAIVSRDALEVIVIEREVDEYVGKKISAAERDSFVKLRKSDRALFDEMIAQRKDMNLTVPVLPVDGGAPPPVAPSASDDQAAWDSL